jgi:hypothetical protein
VLRPRSIAASTLAWAVGAVVSVAIGLIALSMIGTGFAQGPLQPSSPNALTQADAPQSGASPTGTAPSVTSPSPGPTGPAVDRTVTTRGGTVVVRCQASRAYLVGWSPAPGYQTDVLNRGPADRVSIHFEGSGFEIEISAHCVGATVDPSVREEASRGIDH